MTRTFRAPAKINLWLRVFETDDTGYHPLDTLFCAIDFCDEIQITPGGRDIELEVQGVDVGPNETNLAYRAAREYFAALGITAGVHIRLHKMIPAGAGLGGGSSNAATVLRALQELNRDKLPHQDLMSAAARLGSDVPFFLCGSPLAHATGRGEILRPLPALPVRHLLVLVPPFQIATRAAYDWLDESGTLQPPDGALPNTRSWDDVAERARNDFEPVLFARYPVLRQMRDALSTEGARIALVSGSGSALFGIFDDPNVAFTAQRSLAARFADTQVIAAKTVASEPI